MTHEAHLDDGVLLRHLDDEGTTPGQARHLVACSACRDRLDRLSAASASFGRFLEADAEAIDPPVYDPGFLEQLRARAGRELPWIGIRAVGDGVEGTCGGDFAGLPLSRCLRPG